MKSTFTTQIKVLYPSPNIRKVTFYFETHSKPVFKVSKYLPTAHHILMQSSHTTPSLFLSHLKTCLILTNFLSIHQSKMVAIQLVFTIILTLAIFNYNCT